jgi:tetratricopeptide (TPR) repeat protein
VIRSVSETIAIALKQHTEGHLKKAAELYYQILQSDPNHAEALHLLGLISHQIGKHQEAIDLINKAIARNPEVPQFHNTIGVCFEAVGNKEQSIRSYMQALRIKPDYPEACNNLGKVLIDLDRTKEAIGYCIRALRLNRDFPEAWNNLGNALQAQGKTKEAIQYYHQALRLKPAYPTAYNNLGNVLQQSGLLDEAIQAYNHAIRLEPNHTRAHVNRGICHLLMANFEDGWNEYEWRFKEPDRPRWDGSAFEGKRLLVQDEQGFGDSIQFIRYLPMVKSLGGTVIFETNAPLIGLFRGFPGIDKLIERPAHGRPAVEFDLHAYLLSIPRIFRTTIYTIPSKTPYLYADVQKARYWGARLKKGGFKVGIAWAGSPTHRNDRNRSFRLGQFRPLAEVPNVQLYGLQKGEAALQVEDLPGNLMIEDLGPDIKDFSDVAGIIENLDLIVSVDTALVHLAGAMGKSVWTLLPYAPDWRWLLDREDSPWYPTMRLFRQKKPGNWDSVLQRVANELDSLVS